MVFCDRPLRHTVLLRHTELAAEVLCHSEYAWASACSLLYCLRFRHSSPPHLPPPTSSFPPRYPQTTPTHTRLIHTRLIHTRQHTHADTYTRTRTRRLLLPACAYLCTPLAPACCALAAGARQTRRHTRLKRHHARLTRHHTCHPSDRWPSSSRHVATHATSLLLSTLGVVPPWANSGITMTGIPMTPSLAIRSL